jgi:hypothetical protein
MRKLFDEAVGVAPPTRIDIDATIARQRKILLLRRLGAAAVAFVAVTAILVAGNGLDRWSQRSGTTPIGGPGSASPTPDRSPESAEQVMKRQTAAINELLRANLNGVTVADLRTRAATVEVIASKDYPGYLAGNAHMAIAVLRSPAGTGDFGLRVEPRPGTGTAPSPSATTSEPETCDQWQAAIQAQGSEAPSAPQCAQSTGPGGEKVLAFSGHQGQITTFGVLVWRPDSLVSVSARNCWNGWGSDRAPTSFLPQPQLTLNQLTAIAIDPRLAM